MRSTEGKPESHYVRSQIGLLILRQHNVALAPLCACLDVRPWLRRSREPDGASCGLGLLRPREPILLPQRLRLLCAAKRVERVSSDAGAVFGPRMPSS
jgi:hypothetical protein